MSPIKLWVHDAIVEKTAEIAPQVYEVTLAVPHSLGIVPGQYIWVELPGLNLAEEPTGNRRAFSIVRQLEGGRKIVIVFRKSDGGYKQHLLQLPLTSQVRVHGPFGSAFTLKKMHQQQVVILAGGVGIAPFIPILESATAEEHPAAAYLINLHQVGAIPLYSEALAGIKQQASWFDFAVVDHHFEWEDVPTSFQQSATTDNSVWWYISGPQPMVDHMYGVLSEHGVAPKQMVFENFYPRHEWDLTEEKVTESVRREGILANAIQDSSNHTVITDSNGMLLFANKAAQRITGYTFDEMRGNTPRLWGGIMSADTYVVFWKRKQEGLPFSGEFSNRRKSGEVYYALANVAPIFDDERRIIGYIGTEEDITELKQRQAIIETLGNRLALATRSAQIGVWEWNLQTNELDWDEQMRKLYGITEKDLQQSSDYGYWRKQRIHPEDFAAVEQKRSAAIAGTTGYDTSFRIVIPDDNIHYLKVVGIVERDSNGEPMKMVGLNWDVTEEMEIDRAKTEFVSLASHQLRTPLTSINWYTEMLLNQDAGSISEEQRTYLAQVYDSSQRMTELVSTLLNVSRIELGTFAIDPQPTQLTELLTSVLNELRPFIEQKKLQIHETHGELPLIPFDQRLMRIVYQNILTNAVKYTPENGQISITHGLKTTNDGERITIEIADTGVGIPANEQANIFKKLFRASNAQEVDKQGSGLGLYIVEAIVKEAGGSISFDSVENKGTTFHIDLPASGMQKKEGSKPLEMNPISSKSSSTL